MGDTSKINGAIVVATLGDCIKYDVAYSHEGR
jgi:hypothetical protein